jgi:hypothetical protein
MMNGTPISQKMRDGACHINKLALKTRGIIEFQYELQPIY